MEQLLHSFQYFSNVPLSYTVSYLKCTVYNMQSATSNKKKWWLFFVLVLLWKSEDFPVSIWSIHRQLNHFFLENVMLFIASRSLFNKLGHFWRFWVHVVNLNFLAMAFQKRIITSICSFWRTSFRLLSTDKLMKGDCFVPSTSS